MAGMVPDWAARLGFSARGVRGPSPQPQMSPAQMGGGAQPQGPSAARPGLWQTQGAPTPSGPPPPTINSRGTLNQFGQYTSPDQYHHGGFTAGGQPQRWGYQPPGSPGYQDPNARVTHDQQMGGNTFNWFNQNPATGQYDRAPVGFQGVGNPRGIPLDNQGNPKWTPDPRSNPGYFVPDNMKFGDTSANAELNHVKQVNDYWNSVGGGDPTQAAARQRYMHQLQGQIDRGGGAQDFQQGRAGYLKDKIDQLTKLAGSKGGTGKMAQSELERAQSELASIQAGRQGGGQQGQGAQDQGQGTWSEQNAQPQQSGGKVTPDNGNLTLPWSPASVKMATPQQQQAYLGGNGQAYAGGNPNFQMGAGPGGGQYVGPGWSNGQMATQDAVMRFGQGPNGMQQLVTGFNGAQQPAQMSPWAMGQNGFPQDVSNQQMGWGGPQGVMNAQQMGYQVGLSGGFPGMSPQQYGQTMGGMFPGAMPQQGGGALGNLTPQQFNFLSNIPYPSPDGKGGFFNNGTDYGAISNQMAQMGMSPGMSPALRQMGMGGSNMDAGNLAALNAGLDPRDVFSASGYYGNPAGGPFGPQAQAQWGWG